MRDIWTKFIQVTFAVSVSMLHDHYSPINLKIERHLPTRGYRFCYRLARAQYNQQKKNRRQMRKLIGWLNRFFLFVSLLFQLEIRLL